MNTSTKTQSRRGEFVRDRLPDWPAYADKQGLGLIGKGKWRTTRCDFHGGSDSLRVNTESGGWVCMACGAHGGDVLDFHMQARNMGFREAAQALGAWREGDVDAGHHPRTLSARDALELLHQDTYLVWLCANTLTPLTEADRTALGEAARRILLVYEAST